MINFGEAPGNSVLHQGASIPADMVLVPNCKPALRLQRRRGASMSCWFQLRRPLMQQLFSLSREYTPEQVADSVVEAFTEAEEWWGKKTKGPHVHGIDADA